MTTQNWFIMPPTKVIAAPAASSSRPRRKMRRRPARSPSAPPTVTKPARIINEMFRIHWLAVTEMPSELCMLGRPTWVAAMSIAQVERPAAAANTAKRLRAVSIACGAGGLVVGCVLDIVSLIVWGCGQNMALPTPANHTMSAFIIGWLLAPLAEPQPQSQQAPLPARPAGARPGTWPAALLALRPHLRPGRPPRSWRPRRTTGCRSSR
jgi:hypothetical protein